MYHAHNKELPPIIDDGGKLNYGHQENEDNNDNAICKVQVPMRPDHGHQDNEDSNNNAIWEVHVPMLNDTCVSIQTATRMYNGEPNNNDNAPINVYIPKDTNKQTVLPSKNEILTSLMDLGDTQYYVLSTTPAKKKKNRPPLLKHIYKKKTRPPSLKESRLPLRPLLLKYIYKKKAGLPLLKSLLTEDKLIITLTSLTLIPSTTNATRHLWILTI